MRPLTASDLLLARELGERQGVAERALTILALAFPDQSDDDLRRLSLGRRNTDLLDVRQTLFGPDLESFAECPHCGQALEFTLDAAAIHVQPSEAAGAELDLEAEGFALRFRLLDSRDLIAASRSADVEAARALLVERCLVDARFEGRAVAAADLPATVIERLAQALEEGDPQAETMVTLVCPACEREWQLAFDIASFLYTEVNLHAKRVLREVHALARAYAWSEADILAMGARRRRDYLEMLLQ